MEKIENKSLEDEIFGTQEEVVNDIEINIDQNKIDEIDIINEDNKKMGISLTNIVCDHKGLCKLIKKPFKDIPDFSQYKFNNFKILETNDCLNELEEKGGAIILNTDGEIMLRISQDSDFKGVTEDKASKVITNLLGKITIVGRGSKDRPPDIPTHDLMLVSETTFRQDIMAEFYKDGNTYKYNKFKPSELMMLDKEIP